MAQFKVNPHLHEEFSVEADRFQLANDYWYFLEPDGTVVHVIGAKFVQQIERVRS